MKRILWLPVLLLTFPGPCALAADAPALTATANVNLVSDYRFRGITQTWGRPAVQGGADLAWANGLYLGTWASNVSGNTYPGGSLEIDAYGGYNGKIGEDVGWTAGVYAYLYPGADFSRAACPSAAFPGPCALPSQRLDTVELNAGASWKWLSYKLSVSAGDYFGANAKTGYSGHTRGTLYHDLTATVPLADDLGLVAHLGRTDLRGTYGGVGGDTTDWRIALTKTWAGGWSLGGAVVGAGDDRYWHPPVGGLSLANGDRRDVNAPTFVVQMGRTF